MYLCLGMQWLGWYLILALGINEFMVLERSLSRVCIDREPALDLWTSKGVMCEVEVRSLVRLGYPEDITSLLGTY